MVLFLLLLPQILFGELRLDEKLYDSATLKTVPVLYEGRFRPLEVAARLWWKEIYGKESYEGLPADELLWRFHFQGHQPFDDLALFSVDRETKKTLSLPQAVSRFSFAELERVGATQLGDDHPLTNSIAFYLAAGDSTPADAPLMQRLQGADSLLLALPGRFVHGEWLPLRAVALEEAGKPIANFTLYPDETFEAIRSLYAQLGLASENPDRNPTSGVAEDLSHHLLAGYKRLEGDPYRRSLEKSLTYPTMGQLKAELWLYRLPFVEISAACYLLSALIYITYLRGRAPALATGLLTLGLLIHTVPLILRSYALGRPPVTNMFETVLYVPWITALFGLALGNPMARLCGAIGAGGLLTLLSVTGLDGTMENVQAVLDSQQWLLVHVLMVVGSYGIFILGGVLGHIYLLQWPRQEHDRLERIGKTLLASLWVGVALLIPGTILGGVWAAQSWGRFWDWDPKESWALISACVYLVIIHAHTYGYVRHFGLAVGAIAGMLTISFTWYGVNYILGTGLHTYGFGESSHLAYILYILAEGLFISWVLLREKSAKTVENKEPM